MLCFRYFLLRYEDLVNDPTTTLLNLSKKLEIDIGKIFTCLLKIGPIHPKQLSRNGSNIMTVLQFHEIFLKK